MFVREISILKFVYQSLHHTTSIGRHFRQTTFPLHNLHTHAHKRSNYILHIFIIQRKQSKESIKIKESLNSNKLLLK